MKIKKNRKLVILFVFLVVLVSGTGCTTKPDSSPEKNISDQKDVKGLWTGSLKIQAGQELRVVFNISANPDGTLAATMDSPDQGASGIPVEKVTYKEGALRLDVKSIGGVFEGTYKKAGPTIEGMWKQSGAAFPLVLSQIEKVPELHRAQDPVKPYPYTEEEVVYENKEAGVKLAGTLTLPELQGPYPAVLLITGSGPQNRDEEVFGHRPFLVLADYLTRRGIAVLRVDDRGIGGSTGNFSQATTEDFAGDTLAGVEYLKSRKEINPDQIGLIGHSEGGLIAPLAAVQSADVAFIVLLAGPGLTGEEIIRAQSALIAKAEGADNETIEKNEDLLRSMFSVVKEEKNDTIAGEELREVLKDALANMSEQDKQYSNNSEAWINAQVQNMLSPWMRYFLAYDPKPTLMKVKCPVLAINGEKDLQVPAKANLQAIEATLKAGGNKDYTIKEMLDLNHLLQNAKTGSPSEYAANEETISPAALKLVGDWILEHTRGTAT